MTTKINHYRQFVVETNLFKHVKIYFNEISTTRNNILFKNKFPDINTKFIQNEDEILNDFFSSIIQDINADLFSNLDDYSKFISTDLIEKSHSKYFVSILENLSEVLKRHEKNDSLWAFTWFILDYTLHNIFSSEDEEILKPIILDLHKTSIEKDLEDEFMIQQKINQFGFK